MSHYDDVVDYSEDPMEGVDIWGFDAQGEVANMSDLDPSPEVEVPTAPIMVNVEGCNTASGDLA